MAFLGYFDAGGEARLPSLSAGYIARRLLRVPKPFDHPDFLFEPRLDGFRALAHVRGHRCELVSRNGHTFKQWPQLSEEIAHAVRAHSVILDGEICCLEPDGGSHFYAFDVLSIEGDDLNICVGVASGAQQSRVIRSGLGRGIQPRKDPGDGLRSFEKLRGAFPDGFPGRPMGHFANPLGLSLAGLIRRG